MVIIGLITYFIIKLILKIQNNIINNTSKELNNRKTKQVIRNEIEEVIEELEYETNQEKLFYENERKNYDGHTGVIYSNNDRKPTKINSGGELIPANLNDNEKEILQMFYGET